MADVLYQLPKVSQKDLALFIGLHNSPRLTGDVQWPAWTPFSDAIGNIIDLPPLIPQLLTMLSRTFGWVIPITESEDQQSRCSSGR